MILLSNKEHAKTSASRSGNTSCSNADTLVSRKEIKGIFLYIFFLFLFNFILNGL